MSLMQELSLCLILLTVLPDRTFHIKNVVAATSNFQKLCLRRPLNFWSKKVVLNSGRNNLNVKVPNQEN